MAINLSDVRTLVRNAIQDFSHTMIPGDIFTYGTSTVFTLTESNVIAVSSVLINDSAIGDSEYSFDSDRNKVTVTASLTSGDTVEIQYTYYPDYSNTEIDGFTKTAIMHLSTNNYYTFEIDTDGDIFPEPEANEKYLIAFISATLIEPDNKTYRLPDMTINIPTSLPTVDLIRKAISIFKGNTHGIFEVL